MEKFTGGGEDYLQKEFEKFMIEGEVNEPQEAFEDVSDTDQRLGVASERIKLMVSFMQQLKAKLMDYDAYLEKPDSMQNEARRAKWVEEAEVLRRKIDEMGESIREAIAEEVKGVSGNDDVSIRKGWIMVLSDRLGQAKKPSKPSDGMASFGNN